MLFTITREELELQGINYKEALQIIFRNRLFTRGLDLPPKSRQVALKFAQYYLDSGFVCLLAENRWYLTVWLEAQKTNVLNTQIDISTTTESNDTNILSQPAESKMDKDVSTNDNSYSDHLQTDAQELSEFNEPEEFIWEKSPPSLEIDIKPLVQPQSTSELDKNSSHNNSSKSENESPKKRKKRRYRGISY